MRINEVLKELRKEYLGDSAEVQEAKRIAVGIVSEFYNIVRIIEDEDGCNSAELSYDAIADNVERWKARHNVRSVAEDEIW